jgi:DNA invertase Pin-like site-specific DNA recombinase
MDTSMAMGRGMLAIVMVFAQLERETTGERTRATMEDRVERGLWNGGLVYGYSVDPDGKAPYRTGRFRTICAPLKRGERSLALARERRESATYILYRKLRKGRGRGRFRPSKPPDRSFAGGLRTLPPALAPERLTCALQRSRAST